MNIKFKFKSTVNFLSIFIILLLNLIFVNANVDVFIDVNPVFEVDEQVSFSYNITSFEDYNVIFSSSIYCDDIPVANFVENISFVSGETKYFLHNGFLLEDDMKTQKCNATVHIFEPNELLFEEEFLLKNKDELLFAPLICKDEKCVDESRVFYLNDYLYLEYLSTQKNVQINSELLFPDGNKKEVKIPSKLKLTQVGDYKLLVFASKNGFLDENFEIEFSVLEKSIIPTKKLFAEILLRNENGDISTKFKQDENIKILVDSNIKDTKYNLVGYMYKDNVFFNKLVFDDNDFAFSLDEIGNYSLNLSLSPSGYENKNYIIDLEIESNDNSIKPRNSIFALMLFILFIVVVFLTLFYLKQQNQKSRKRKK